MPELRINPSDFYRGELPDMPTPKPGTSGWVDGGLCPFHDDRNAGSFKINVHSGGFKCFSCGAAGGDMVDFMQLRDGIGYREALQRLGLDSTLPPAERRQRATMRRRADLEAALQHELIVLVIGMNSRANDRLLSRDRRYCEEHPEFKPMPPERWERETLAARRIGKLIDKLYFEGVAHAV